MIFNEYQNYKYKKKFKALKLLTKKVYYIQKIRFKKKIRRNITFKTYLVCYLFSQMLTKKACDIDLLNEKSLKYKQKYVPFPISYEYFFIFFFNLYLKEYYYKIVLMYFELFEFWIYNFEHYNFTIVIFSEYTRLLKGYEKRTFFFTFHKNYNLFISVMRVPFYFLIWKLIYLFYEFDSAFYWDLYTPFKALLVSQLMEIQTDSEKVDILLQRMLRDLKIHYTTEKKYRHFKLFKFKWFKRICDWLLTIMKIATINQQDYFNLINLSVYDALNQFSIFDYSSIFNLNCWYFFYILHYIGDKVEVRTEVDQVRPYKEFFFDHSKVFTFKNKQIGYPYREIFLPTHWDQTKYVKYWERYSHIGRGFDISRIKRKISFKEKVWTFEFMAEIILWFKFLNAHPELHNIFNDQKKPQKRKDLKTFKISMLLIRKRIIKTRKLNYIFDNYF